MCLGLLQCVASSELCSIAQANQFANALGCDVSLGLILHEIGCLERLSSFLVSPGYWDATTKSITVTKAFPCRALEPGEGQGREQTVEMDPESEIETRAAISKRGMVVVGWYHSHPVFIAEPSIRTSRCYLVFTLCLVRCGCTSVLVGVVASYLVCTLCVLRCGCMSVQVGECSWTLSGHYCFYCPCI